MPRFPNPQQGTITGRIILNSDDQLRPFAVLRATQEQIDMFDYDRKTKQIVEILVSHLSKTKIIYHGKIEKIL